MRPDLEPNRTKATGSEPTRVPNGSELRNSGRHPVMSDDDLLSLARTLFERVGRAPTASELMGAAGGCQKQRALRAIRVVSLEWAERAVRSQLVLPESFEHELRDLSRRWLTLAAEQLAEKHLDAERRADEKAATLGALVEELQARIQELEIQLESEREAQDKLRELNRQLAVRIAETEADLVRFQTLADERERVINQLSASRGQAPAPVAALATAG